MDAAILASPGVGFFSMLLIGFIAGAVAEKVTASDHGILTNILVGIAGSFVGGTLADVAGIPVYGFVRTLIAASLGAILVLTLWRKLRD